ncbi:MAG: hypothetical protein J7M27_13115 [Candidatus Latescibacteria bacterium]|nr:hypothetical protein [Candidatus Latescibacterota bacterium]
MRRSFSAVLLCPLLLFASEVLAEEIPWTEKRIQGDGGRGPYVLTERIVFEESDSVWVDEALQQRGLDYTMEYVYGRLTFRRSVSDSSWIRAKFRALPFDVQRVVRHREIVLADTTSGKEMGKPVREVRERRASAEQDFSQLQVGGSKTFGITIGSNRDLSLEQALRINLSGKIGKDVEVVALLSDQNVPIQPEGTTQQLKELDKVLIEIKTSHLSATMGDYVLDLTSGRFGRVNRRLEGVMGRISYPRFGITAAGAVSKGIFHTQRFSGIEGNQGPYQLRAEDGDAYIVVLAGTERVWVNGQRMVRGSDNDYTIEYGNGQITFTERRLITGDSRIVVDFEYTNQRYPRSLVGGSGRFRFWGDRIRFGTMMVQESDDRDNPMGLAFGAEEQRQLREAGDDPTLASTSGADSVGADQGNYRAEYDSTGAQYYEFAGASGGPYRVAFSWAGEGKGAYNYIGGGIYRYVGAGNGAYLPRTFLPLPKRHRLMAFDLSLKPASAFEMGGELALSSLDQNTFSAKDDGDNGGLAYRINALFTPKELRIGRVGLGDFELSGERCFRERAFHEIGRAQNVEADRRWGLVFQAGEGEATNEFSARYRPTGQSRIGGSYGRTERGAVRSERREWDFAIAEQHVPNLLYTEARMDHTDATNLSGRTIRRRGQVGAAYGHIRPHVEYQFEEITRKLEGRMAAGAAFDSWETEIATVGWKRLAGSLGFHLRKDRWWQTEWMDQSKATTPQLRFSIRDWRSLSVNAEYTHREKTFYEAYIAATNEGNLEDSKSDLAQVRVDFAPWDGGLSTSLKTHLSNTRIARKKRNYIYVGTGNGIYVWEDRNENAVKEEDEYVPDPDGEYVLYVERIGDFQPIMEVRTGVRMKWEPGKMLRGQKSEVRSQKSEVRGQRPPLTTHHSPLTKTGWWPGLSGETSLEGEQKVQRGAIRGNPFSPLSFSPDSTTVRAWRRIRQDVYLLRGKRTFSVRLRYNRNDRWDNEYTGGVRETRTVEQSLRVRSRFLEKLNLEWTCTKTDQRRTDQSLSDYRIAGWELNGRLSYRPRSALETSLKLGWSREHEREQDLRANRIFLKPGISYSLRGKGRLRAHVDWTSVTSSPSDRSLVYPMAKGRRIGETLNGDLTLDYRIGRYMTAFLSYNGRKDPGRKIIHTGRMEVKAYF